MKAPFPMFAAAAAERRKSVKCVHADKVRVIYVLQFRQFPHISLYVHATSYLTRKTYVNLFVTLHVLYLCWVINTVK